MDREKVINELNDCLENQHISFMDGVGDIYAVSEETIRNVIALLKEKELPTELKQKMWNALYAEEDEYEKKFVGKVEHLNWFTVYRPWLQKGFDIAINAIADWEGR